MELKKNDIIEGPLEPAEPIEWISNIVVTEKKDTGKIWMNIDLRHANIAIKESHVPVPTVHMLRHKLNGASVFTKLDLKHSFHQMLLGEKSRHLTNFYTPEGIYRFKRLVMGAGPASQEFHERFRRNLVGYEGVLQIEDDLLVYGADQKEHDNNLNQILDRLAEMGVTLNKEKCEWSQNQVLWFGYQFSQAGMAPDPNKVKAIQQLSSPTSTAEVKSFLQMCQYNAMFMLTDIATYSDVTAPLRALLQKDVKFEWSQKCEDAVQTLKKALVSEQVMAYWDQNRKTELVVDRGPDGVAATLYQQDPKTNHWLTVF